jgi:hypothetical protein
VIMSKPQTTPLVAEALKQTRLAYQFAPGSYTYSALAAVIAAATETHADWIDETLEWNTSVQPEGCSPNEVKAEAAE